MNKIFLLIFAISTICFSQELPIPQIKFSPNHYICYKANEPIIIDGKINEAEWAKAEWTNNFVDIEGSVKPTPRFRTRAKMLWDDNYFYVAAEIDEPDIMGTIKNRDEVIFYDNDFEIFIDPDNNTHEYSEFEMNALNTVWDLLLIKPYRDTKNAAVNNWDYKGLKTAVSIYGTLNNPNDKDSCWTIEIAFPWQSFKEIAEVNTPPKDKDQWRLNFSRVEWKTEVKDGKYQKQINPATGKPYPEDNWVWSPQGVVNMHYPEMWGYVQFSTNIVGNKKEDFAVNEDEAAKWYLRQIYYNERNYFEKNGKYSDDLEALGISNPQVPGFKSIPIIEYTSDMFEAYLQSDNSSKKVHIRNDGLTWITGSQQ